MAWILLILTVIVIFIVTTVNSANQLVKKRHENKTNMKQKLIEDGFQIDGTVAEMLVQTELFIDSKNKNLAILNYETGQSKHFEFSSLIDCEIIENSTTIQKGGVGRAVLGGILAGGVGAIVGATTRKSTDVVKNLSVRIITKNIVDALYVIDLILEEVKTDSMKYKTNYNFAQKVYATIFSVIDSNK